MKTRNLMIIGTMLIAAMLIVGCDFTETSSAFDDIELTAEENIAIWAYSVGLEDFSSSYSNGILELTYVIPPDLLGQNAHFNLISSAFLQAATFYTDSESIVLNEKINSPDTNFNFAVRELDTVSVDTVDILAYVNGDIDLEEFIERIDIVILLNFEDLVICGDSICNGDENCDTCEDCSCSEGEVCDDGACAADLSCEEDSDCSDDQVCLDDKCTEVACTEDSECDEGQICSDYECIEVVCAEDLDCNDEDYCTDDSCSFAGNINAVCSYDDVDDCDDNDGCCPSGCIFDDDNDCEETNETEVDAGDSSWTTGSVTLPTELDGDHAFFDFETQSIISDFNTGDIFTNFFNDLMGECNEGGVSCGEVKLETSLTFEEMIDPPTEDYEGSAEPSVGERYWVKTIEGNYGKLEITAIDDETSITFDWGFQE